MSKKIVTAGSVSAVQTTATAMIRTGKAAEAAAVEYVEINGVTADTVGAHALLITGLHYPGVKPSGRADRDSEEYAAHLSRVKYSKRLKAALGVESKPKAPSTNLLSGLGVETFADMSDDEIMVAVRKELAARVKADA